MYYKARDIGKQLLGNLLQNVTFKIAVYDKWAIKSQSYHFVGGKLLRIWFIEETLTLLCRHNVVIIRGTQSAKLTKELTKVIVNG